MKNKILCVLMTAILAASFAACEASSVADNAQSNILASTEKEGELPEEILTMLDETMSEISGVNPGSAGSSLRGVAAMGHLLDLSEMVKTDTDKALLIAACRKWTDENLPDADSNQYFNESYLSVRDGALNYLKHPDQYPEIEDCGYTYKNEIYNLEYLRWICDCIEASRTVE